MERCKLSGNDPAFEFLGRHNQSIFLVNGANIRYLLFPTEIADVLDGYPEVVRRSQTGFLNFRSTLTEDARRPYVTVEIEWRGSQGSAADEIAERLITRSEFLREALRDQVCSLQVVLRDPDTLENIHKV